MRLRRGTPRRRAGNSERGIHAAARPFFVCFITFDIFFECVVHDGSPSRHFYSPGLSGLAHNTGKPAKGGLDFNIARPPSVVAVDIQGAEIIKTGAGGGMRVDTSSFRQSPKFAQYYSVGSIPYQSRKSIGDVGEISLDSEVGDGTARRRRSLPASPTRRAHTQLQMSPTASIMAKGPQSPIYILKNHTAEWNSDFTMHPLLLATQRQKGWANTPDEAVPKDSKHLTVAARESHSARLRRECLRDARVNAKQCEVYMHATRAIAHILYCDTHTHTHKTSVTRTQTYQQPANFLP